MVAELAVRCRVHPKNIFVAANSVADFAFGLVGYTFAFKA
jgi:hypothetical protein